MTSPYSFLQLMSHIYGIVPYYLEPGEAFPLPTIGLIYPLVPPLYIDPPLYIYTVLMCARSFIIWDRFLDGWRSGA